MTLKSRYSKLKTVLKQERRQNMGKKAQCKSGWFTYHPIPQKIKAVFTGHICPWCKSKAHAQFVMADKSLLDPRIRKTGFCANKDCLNSAYYSSAHQDPPFTKKELRSRKRKIVGVWQMIETEEDPNLLQARVTSLAKKRLEKLGSTDTLLACPACNEWKMKLEYFDQGGFKTTCQKCTFTVQN